MHPAGRGAPTFGARSSRTLRRVLRCASKRDPECRRGVRQRERQLWALRQLDSVGRGLDPCAQGDGQRRNDAQCVAEKCGRRRCAATAGAGALMRGVRRPCVAMRRVRCGAALRSGHRHVRRRVRVRRLLRMLRMRGQCGAVHRARAPLHRTRNPDGKSARAQQAGDRPQETATHGSKVTPTHQMQTSRGAIPKGRPPES